VLRLCGCVMEEHNNTYTSDKRKREADGAQKYRERKRVRPISDEHQTIQNTTGNIVHARKHYSLLQMQIMTIIHVRE